MPDVITETTNRSYFNRIGGSFAGIGIGLILFIGSFVALWWNEGNFVRVARGLEEGKNSVVILGKPEVKPENEGKLVYMTGKPVTKETLTDPVFGISSQSLLLDRKVEMYQWKETSESHSEEKIGGSEETVTTYRYNKEWSKDVISSANFKESAGHVNPDTLPYPQYQAVAQDARVGQFTLSESVIRKIGGATEVPVDTFQVATVPGSQLFGNYIYLGKDTAAPAVGDTRISFAEVKPSDVSVVAQQNGSTFGPFRTKTGSTIELVAGSTKSADELFTSAEKSNEFMTWIIRGLGFGAMWLGMMLILGPLSMFFAFIPFLKNVTGFFVGIATLPVALVLSTLTIALAWMFYRPLVSLALIAGAVAIAWAIKVAILDKRKKSEQTDAPAPQQPPQAAPFQSVPTAPVAPTPMPQQQPEQTPPPQQPPQVPPAA